MRISAYRASTTGDEPQPLFEQRQVRTLLTGWQPLANTAHLVISPVLAPEIGGRRLNPPWAGIWGLQVWQKIARKFTEPLLQRNNSPQMPSPRSAHCDFEGRLARHAADYSRGIRRRSFSPAMHLPAAAHMLNGAKGFCHTVVGPLSSACGKFWQNRGSCSLSLYYIAALPARVSETQRQSFKEFTVNSCCLD